MHLHSKFAKAVLRARLALKVLTQFESSPARSKFRVSFSQMGEDVIIQWMLGMCGITDKPRYLDIGAHDPEFLSNTAMFYLLGARGINIEPDPDLFKAFQRQRPEDINLNIGIGDAPGSFDFFRMAEPVLNTFSEAEALRISREQGINVVERIKVEVRTIRDVLDQLNFKPDFMSIDVEGYDLAILQSYDFEKHRPAIICAETIEFSTTQQQNKNTDIIAFIESKEYFSFVDTRINTIFCDTRIPQLAGLRKKDAGLRAES